jgi:aspartate racemase
MERRQECCVHELVQAQAECAPDAIAVVEGRAQLTYRDLDSRANRLAAYLRKRGVGPDVPVAICLKRSADLVVSMLAVLKAGGACVPLDPAYPAERLQYMLQDTQAALLLTQPGLLPAQARNGREVIELPEAWAVIDQESSEACASGATPKNLAHIIYTSGSTGKPRGVMLTHEGMVNHHVASQSLYGLQSSDRVLQFSSISFDIALEEIFPTWIAGATLVLRTEETPLGGRDFVRWIDEQGITVLDLPTAYWHELVHQLSDLQQPMPASTRLVIVGGEKASARAFASWSKLVAGRVRWINTYGPSEASIIATAYEPSGSSWDATENIPIGRPVENTNVYLLDGDLNPVPAGESGELHIGGVGLARGYLNQPQRTAEKFIADPFSPNAGARLYKTGDMARYLPSGEIEFLGRADDQVKIRGFRVELGEVEGVLAKHAGVQECVVVLRGDEASKQLAAYFVPVRKPGPATWEVRQFLKDRLPEYMVPAAIVTLERLPLTPNGKVDKKSLPQPTQVQASLNHRCKAPRDTVEAQVAEIWESVFAKGRIGVDEDFFELGGHSLLAVRLMHSVEQTFGKRLPITALLQASTIEKMTALLREKESSRDWSSLVAMRMDGSNPPFFCVHGIGGTVLRFRELARLVGDDQPFYGLQAQGLDGKFPALARVEDMAAHYVKELQSAQPEGPYYLGGYSFGGMVALEMAHLLRAAGQEVPLVVLLDTFPGTLKSTGSLFGTYLTLPLDQKWMHFSRKAKALPRSLRRRVAMMKLPAALKQVRDACYTAARTYQPRPYDGPVVLFRASEKGLSSVNQESAWKSVAPCIEIYEVSGHHGNIVDPPQVGLLAEEIKARLEAAYHQQDEEPAMQPASFVVSRSEGRAEIA